MARDYFDACALLTASEIALILRTDPDWQLPTGTGVTEHRDAARRMDEARQLVDETNGRTDVRTPTLAQQIDTLLAAPMPRRTTMKPRTPQQILAEIDGEETAEPTVGGGSCDDGVPERFGDEEADRNLKLAEIAEIGTGAIVRACGRRVARAIRRERDGKVFHSGAREAAELLGVVPQKIYNAVSGRQTLDNSTWSYVDDASELDGAPAQSAAIAPDAPSTDQPKRGAPASSRPVRRESDGRIFPGGATEAAAACDISREAIYIALSKGTKSAGSTWSYAPPDALEKPPSAPVVEQTTPTAPLPPAPNASPACSSPRPISKPSNKTMPHEERMRTPPASTPLLSGTRPIIVGPAPGMAYHSVGPDLTFLSRAMLSLGRGGQQLDPSELGHAIAVLAGVADAKRTLDLIESGQPIRFNGGRFVPADTTERAPGRLAEVSASAPSPFSGGAVQQHHAGDGAAARFAGAGDAAEANADEAAPGPEDER